MTAVALRPAHFPWFDYSRYAFSLGIAAGGFSVLSGHTGSAYDAETRRVSVAGGMAAQARTAYAKVATILEAGQRDLGDVVRLVEYVTPAGLERYGEAAAVRDELFGRHRPALNTVPVRALLRDGALIEIEATAGPAADGGPVARESGRLVFLPSIHPTDEAGAVVGAGDVIAQTEMVYDRAARILDALGLSLADVVKTIEYITPAALEGYRGTARIRRDRVGPVYPAAAGIVMPALAHPGALVQLDLIASRDTKTPVNPGWRHYDSLTYSPAVRAGRMLFISGQGAIDGGSGQVVHGGDVGAQAEFIYGNIARILAAAGGGIGDLVQTVEYTVPAALPRYREVAEVRRRLLKAPLPAATGPVCEGLLRTGMLIEIDPVAVLDG